MDCIATSSVPPWMTQGRTHLLIKDPAKGPLPGNFRPITCLPAMWKLFTGIMSDSIYSHLKDQHLFPTEQKGCKKNSRGCKEQLLIDKMILKNCKRRHTNLSMAYIDYKKAYDKIPHSWILESMTMCGVAPEIVALFKTSLAQSVVQLRLGTETLGTIHNKRGIFQGDSVSPLQFVIGLIPLSLLLRKSTAGYQVSKGGPKVNHRLYMDDLKLYGKSDAEIEDLVTLTSQFSTDIRMEFGIEKCASLKLLKGKKVASAGISTPDGATLLDLTEEGYRYLGILESDQVLHRTMKENTTAEYLRRVKRLLKSSLNGKNCFQAINTWAVPVIRYGAGILDWTATELRALDTKTRKLLRIHGAHHPQGDVDRLYVSRQRGGRGLQSIEEVVRREENSLTTFMAHTTDPELLALKPHMDREKILKGEDIDKVIDKQRDESFRETTWKDKVMHGQYIRKMAEGPDTVESWSWLHQQDLKKETEGFLIAAQDQALRTNYVKHKIDKDPSSPLCRLCHTFNETVDHITSCCPKLAQSEYKSRHDKVAATIHWGLCKQFNLPHAERWYEHRAEKVDENDDIKLLWDFHIQSDHVIEACRPDIVIVKKKLKTALIIDIAVPGDSRVCTKGQEKILKYQDLKREIKKLWQLKEVRIVPIIVGALGAVPPDLRKHLDDVDCRLPISSIQKTALLGTAHILRKVLDV